MCTSTRPPGALGKINDLLPSLLGADAGGGKHTPEVLEVLPVAAQPEPVRAVDEAKAQTKRLREKDDHCLRELRICLRAVLEQLRKEKRYTPFWRPVDPEETPDYYEVIRNPIDLETIRAKVDAADYLNLQAFLDDVDLIRANAEV